MFGIVLFTMQKQRKKKRLESSGEKGFNFHNPSLLKQPNKKNKRRRKSYALIGTYRLKTWKRKFVKLKNGFSSCCS